MPEIGKFERSWLLLKTSLSVLSQNRTLLLFPLVTAVFVAGIVLFFTAPVILMPTGHPILSSGHWAAVEQRLFDNSPTQPIRNAVEAVNRGDPSVDFNFDAKT